MSYLKSQRGVGLVEVLVAVLLLSIAVLGFSALQVRAIGATDESLVRTKSLTIVRNLAETMRAHPDAYVTVAGAILTEAKPADSDAISTVQAVVSSTATDTISIGGTDISILSTGNNCLSTTTQVIDSKVVPKQPCTINQLAARDAMMVKKIAADEGVTLSVITCPGTTTATIQQQMCIITAWNDTKAMMDDTDTEACANASGVYKPGSSCLISEAY